MASQPKPKVLSDLANPEAEENFKRLMRAGLEGGEPAMREEWNRIFPNDPVKLTQEPIESLRALFGGPKPATPLLPSVPSRPKVS